MKILRLLVLLAFSAAAWAQAPADGAIWRGRSCPVRKAACLEKGPAKKAEQEMLEKRCEELSGSLREDCLKQQREQAPAIFEGNCRNQRTQRREARFAPR